MKKFIDEGVGERDARKKKRKALCDMETEVRLNGKKVTFELRNTRELVNRMDNEPHKFPNIVVCDFPSHRN